MNLFSLLFSFKGRIGRTHWWLGMTVVAASTASAILGVGYLHMAPIFFLPCALFSTFPIFALGIKRLHDRALTGWYIAWITLIPAMLFVLAVRVTEGSPIWWAFSSVALLLAIWGLTELGFRSGTAGENEYGPAVADEAPAMRVTA